MKSVLIQLDEPTLRALNRIAPPGKRQRSDFIRESVRAAVRKAEYAAMKKAYLAQPDDSPADDWANAEEFRA